MTVMKLNRCDSDVEITLKGHAEYSLTGNDIVCSSISVLCYTLLNYLSIMEEKGKCTAEAKDVPGDFKINVNIKDSEIWDIVEGFFLTGMIMISEEYPENLKIEVISDEISRTYRKS